MSNLKATFLWIEWCYIYHHHSLIYLWVYVKPVQSNDLPASLFLEFMFHQNPSVFRQLNDPWEIGAICNAHVKTLGSASIKTRWKEAILCLEGSPFFIRQRSKTRAQNAISESINGLCTCFYLSFDKWQKYNSHQFAVKQRDLWAVKGFLKVCPIRVVI